MKNYCLKSKKDTKIQILKFLEQKITDYLICSDCKNKKSQIVKKQEAEGLLSNLGINTPFSKIPLLNVYFKV